MPTTSAFNATRKDGRTNPIEGANFDWPVGFRVDLDLASFWRLEDHKLGETTFTHFADGTAHGQRLRSQTRARTLAMALAMTAQASAMAQWRYQRDRDAYFLAPEPVVVVVVVVL